MCGVAAACAHYKEEPNEVVTRMWSWGAEVAWKSE